MPTLWLLLIMGGVAGWIACIWANRRAMKRCHLSGEPQDCIILFVEPIRWLFIIWGFALFCRGMRQGGYRGQLRLFRWCTGIGSLLVVSDLVRQSRLLGKAEALARYVERIAAERPGVPIHLVGYSSGCYVALEACRRMCEPRTVQKLVLLAGSVSPRYSLDHLKGRVEEVRSFHSPIDLIVGIGPAIFGTNDRRWTPGCGALGFRDAPDFVTQRPWRPADVRLGYLGDHFTIAAPAFVAREIAPLLSVAAAFT